MAVFQADKLSVLEVDGFEGLTSMNAGIGQLIHLLRLSYTHNSLKALPTAIERFQSLKYFDLSYNKLSSVPRELYQLVSLQTLILARNDLCDDSFQDIQSSSNPILPMLRHVDLSHNKLSKVPEFVIHAEQVTELFASDNEIDVLSSNLLCKGHLRVLSLARNHLTALPYEVTELKKLKTFEVKENPIKDKRLLKLIAQHGDTKPKTVLDYVSSKGPPPSHQSERSNESVAKVSSPKKILGAQRGPLHVVEVRRTAAPLSVTTTRSARLHRAYLVCTLIKQLDLTEARNVKKFLAIQTTLHDTVCHKRKLVTIATHNMAALTPPLLYDARPLEDVSLTPLGYTQPTTAKDFMALLQENKLPARAGKKNNKPKKAGVVDAEKKIDPIAASLSKYLDLVEGRDEIAMLSDSTSCVFSLPPLTNSEVTKLSPGVHDVLVEVSSMKSLPACKNIMNALLLDMIKSGLRSVNNSPVSLNHDSDIDDSDDEDDDVVKFEEQSTVSSRGVHLTLEPVRVVDGDSSLLAVFPSRTDLKFDRPDIEVQGL